jgi:hypothetical protein
MLNDVVAALKGSAARSNRILQGVKGAVSSPGHVCCTANFLVYTC